MSLFAKFCQGKESETGPGPVESSLPNQFDTGRRTSVSAECWMQACDSYQCAQSARLPSKNGSRAAAAAITPRQSGSNAAQPANASQAANASVNGNGSATATATETITADGSSAGSPAVTTLSGNDAAIPASEKEAFARVAIALRNTIFFKELSDDLMRQVLSALQKRSVDSGVNVIEQGSEGDELFVLDKGKVEFIRDNSPVGEATAGSTFGELALLYNSPRAATVRTQEPSVVYTLDRITFKRIMVAKLSRKRVHSQQVLASIDVFTSLPQATQLRIADALHPVTYHRGDVVIQKGDSGKDFFLIDEGTVEVSIDGKTVGELGSGSYFGELALIYDLPRAATITATSEVLKLEALSSAGFEQLIGPDLVSELRKRDPRKSE